MTTDFTAANALGYTGTYEAHDFASSAMLFVGFRTSRGVCAQRPGAHGHLPGL